MRVVRKLLLKHLWWRLENIEYEGQHPAFCAQSSRLKWLQKKAYRLFRSKRGACISKNMAYWLILKSAQPPQLVNIRNASHSFMTWTWHSMPSSMQKTRWSRAHYRCFWTLQGIARRSIVREWGCHNKRGFAIVGDCATKPCVAEACYEVNSFRSIVQWMQSVICLSSWPFSPSNL